MLDKDFTDWMNDLPIDFIRYMYELWLRNTIQDGDNFRVVKILPPITEQDITNLENSLTDNGIIETT